MFVFTSCTNNYIPKARVLASTLKSFHPDWTFCLLLGETPPEGFSLESEPFDRLVTFDQLEIPAYHSWLFRHRVVEICTAAKGPALYHFLVREKHEKVIYLDPDIMVCNTLATLDTLLDEHSLLLTPHQLAPQETAQSIMDNELCVMKYGVFNLGFVAAAARGDGPKFARWWRNRLLEYCYDDIPRGLFTDQRWCDLAPAFFPELHIVRDPGCNAASWNLTDRKITRTTDGTFMANDTPLRFYHFTGFDSGAGDAMTARYAKDMPAVHELWALYRERLMSLGHAELGKLRWAHMQFSDGTPITDAMRLTYRSREDIQHAFPDPFTRPGYLEWFLAEQQITKHPGIHRYQRKVISILHKIKGLVDLHGGFPRGVPGTARQAVVWLKKWGVLGVARKVWQSASDGRPPVENLPPLHLVMDYPESAFFQLLQEKHAPVCVIEHDWGGGASSYCEDRVEELLSRNHAVIRVRYVIDLGRIEMTVCYGEQVFRCQVGDLSELADNRFPRITAFVINELAGWHYCNFNFAEAAVMMQDTVRELARIVRHHKAHLEFLFHDYFAVCPTITLVTSDNRFCGLSATNETCDICALKGKPFSMQKWREAWSHLLDMADEVVFFSDDTRDRVLQVYPLRQEQIKVRPHAVKPLGDKLNIQKGGPMKVAVVGHIQPHKGADIVFDIAKLLEKHVPEASIIVFGTLEIPYIPNNITVLGGYERDNLGTLMKEHNITVGLFPSICPETFSFVVHEMAELDLPLVSFDLGAQGAFTRTLPNSRVVTEISSQAAFDALQELDGVRTSSTN